MRPVPLVAAFVLLLEAELEDTLTSPVAVTLDVLRFLEAGGVEGGAEATVAFFLLRAMIAKRKLFREKMAPILKD